MSDDFIRDLDEYFGKTYTDFDRIGSMPSYESVTVSLVLKNRNRIEEGQNLTDEVRKIAYQPQAAQVLAELKERHVDETFSFSFRVAPLKKRIAAAFSRKGTAGHFLATLIGKYGGNAAEVPARLGISEAVWQGICKGKYIPEKQLLFKAMLLYGFSREDGVLLMRLCGAYYDHECVRDVVVHYLISYRVLNEDMIARAFEEYRLRPLL